MHELSLARALLQQVDAIAALHPGHEVAEVCVSLGPLAGVEPALLADAAQRLLPEHGHVRAKLCLREVDLLARCAACGVSFEVRHLVFRCPACGGGRVQIERGDALVLQAVQLVAAGEPEEAA
jgi:hydrogenase nickel incorporation protein HypA/HybF